MNQSSHKSLDVYQREYKAAYYQKNKEKYKEWANKKYAQQKAEKEKLKQIETLVFIGPVIPKNILKARKSAIRNMNRRLSIKDNPVLLAIEREKGRIYAATHRKSRSAAEHQLWLDATREKRKIYKQKRRMADGARPRIEITLEAQLKRDQAQQAREYHKNYIGPPKPDFIGPPKPGKWIGDAVYYAWKVENNPIFYVKELDRVQRYKMKTRENYRGSCFEWETAPDDVIKAKHLVFLIGKQLRRSELNEKH
jgi:hypothetical protein